MARNVIGIKLVADTRDFVRNMQGAVRQFTSVEQAASSASRKIGTNQKAFTAIGVGAGASMLAGIASSVTAHSVYKALFGPALQAASEFEREFSRTLFLSQVDPSSKWAQKLEGTIRSVGLRSQFTEAETARALGNLITAGLTKEEARRAVNPLVDMVTSSFGEIGLDQGAKIMAIALRKFKMPEQLQDAGDQARYVANNLLAFKQASRIEFGEILGFLDSLQASPKTLKGEMPVFLTLATTLARLGTSARRSGQQVNSLSSSMLKVLTAIDESGLVESGNFGKLIRGAAEGLGLEEKMFRTANGELKDTTDILELIVGKSSQIEKQFGELDADKLVYRLFSNKTGATIAKAIRTAEYPITDLEGNIVRTAKGFEAFLLTLNDFHKAQEGGGLAAKGAETYLQTWEGISKVIKGVWENILRVIASTILTAFKPLLITVRDLLTMFAEFLAVNPKIAKGLAVIATVSFGLLVTFSLLAVSIGAIGMAALIALPGVMQLATAVGALGLGATVLLPVLAVIVAGLAAIGAVAVAMGIVLYRNMQRGGSIFDWLSKKVDQFKLVFQGVKEMWTDLTAPKSLVDQMKKLGVWEFVKSLMMLKFRVQLFWDSLTKNIDWSTFDESIKGLRSAFGDLMQTLGKPFGRDNIDGWTMLGKAMSIVADMLLWFASFAVDAITATIMALDIFIDTVGGLDNAREIIGQVGTGIMIIGASFLAVGAIVALFVAGIILLTAVVHKFYKFFVETLSEGLLKTGRIFWGVIKSIHEGVNAVITGIIDFAASVFPVLLSISSWITPFGYTLGNALALALSNGLESGYSYLKAAVSRSLDRLISELPGMLASYADFSTEGSLTSLATGGVGSLFGSLSRSALEGFIDPNTASYNRQNTGTAQTVNQGDKRTNVQVGKVEVKTNLEDPATMQALLQTIMSAIGNQLNEDRVNSFEGGT